MKTYGITLRIMPKQVKDNHKKTGTPLKILPEMFSGFGLQPKIIKQAGAVQKIYIFI